MRRSAAAAGAVAWLATGALASAHGPPPPKTGPIPRNDLIPARDRESYFSRVTRVEPTVPGLRVRMLGHQDLLELRWTGRQPLVVLGTLGEPMFRLGPAGVEVNRHSPTAWRSAERYARVRVPAFARPRTAPRWERLAEPGPWRWNEHRAQWMTRARPAVVGEGGARRTIRRWSVPVRVGERRVRIAGLLEWIPSADALRDERSEASSPLLSLAIVLGAMGLGAAAGVRLRDRPRP